MNMRGTLKILYVVATLLALALTAYGGVTQMGH
jgi:hypothetical protein